ncbi:hypothetical protein [Bacillus sp. JJ722]|uniref:hypothetical protein n=1 Tax=Bacillus sp. JJ722 TaxID=3122973 RepID=UPI002FFF403E
MNNYFYCYSPKLKTRLLEMGERFICVGLHETTGRKFWLFAKSETVDAVLAEWRANKPA